MAVLVSERLIPIMKTCSCSHHASFHLGVACGEGHERFFPVSSMPFAVDSGLCWFRPVHGSEADDPVNWNDMECTFSHIDIGGMPGANV